VSAGLQWRTGYFDPVPRYYGGMALPTGARHRRGKTLFALEKVERLRRKEAGDPDWRKFAVRRNYTGTLDQVWDDLVAHQNGTAYEGQEGGWGVFVVVNEGGRNKKSITRVRALFIDGDGIPLPLRWHCEPDFIVQRDETHWHAYWLVDDCPVEAFEAAQKRLIVHYGSDPAICDLSRVLRVPGTIHQKGAPIQMVLIPKRDPSWEPRRTLAELMEALPALPASE
jgi:hypothetical protein